MSYGQDTREYVIGKATNGGGRLATVPAGGRGGGDGPKVVHVGNMNKLAEEDDAFTVKRVGHDLKMNIQKARTKKGWSQKEFAAACSENIKVVQDYEAGKAAPNQQVIAKMERALGVYLRGAKALEPIGSK